MSKKVLTQGPIQPDKIAKSISNHSSKTAIGAHNIFLGQVPFLSFLIPVMYLS